MNTAPLLSAIEAELQKQVARLEEQITRSFHEMLTYHMGWTGEGVGVTARGKRLRPLLVLLTAASCGEFWLRAVPAAAAIELVHNFSLVHDDIQDASELRRGRPTAWSKWGAATAINVGDALFVIANQSMLDLAREYPAHTVVKAVGILNGACLDLARGQYLDMAYAGRTDLDLDDYWPVIRGKTAALMAASCASGALLGGADAARQESFRAFGEYLGMAFQAQDDILGIWGDEKVTGKSAASDLIEGKNSLPVLYGLGRKGRFSELWKKGRIPASEVNNAAKLLAEEGADVYARQQAEALTGQALHHLETAQPQGEAGEALFELASKLLKREQ